MTKHQVVRQISRIGDESGGVTLTELVVTLLLGLLIGAAALAAIEGARSSSTRTTARQEAVTETEFALARITRETRQATVLAVQGAGVLDLKTRARSTAGAASELHRIRYDCSQGSACVRKDCGLTSPGGSLVGSDCDGAQSVILRGVELGEFLPQLNGATLAVPPARETPAVDFLAIRLRVRLDDFTAGRESVANAQPIEITGGVEIANVEN